ncbi:MAG: DUF3179 domain-containing protein [Gammaproteobacteria bacterium]|nr:DUF3179 domain-containing protein [Gammaproteobacteria bacterium]
MSVYQSKVGMRDSFLSVWVAVLATVLASGAQGAKSRNGFDLSNASIPIAEIRRGGPPKDGIPAIVRPIYINVEEVDYLTEDDRVLGIEFEGVVKAFPVKILNRHEVVNDWTQKRRFVMTYCPLCGSGMAFAIEGDRAFGVSGLLYNSDVLLYDFATQSLWSQILGEAITGPLVGQKLVQLPVLHTIWSHWKDTHPDTLVLSTDTGYPGYSYDEDPYVGYERRKRLAFPVGHKDKRFHPKAWVLGVSFNGHHKAYPFVELERSGSVNDEIGGEQIQVRYVNGDAWAEQDGEILVTTRLYWFAWYAFHPDTEVFTAPPP